MHQRERERCQRKMEEVKIVLENHLRNNEERENSNLSKLSDMQRVNLSLNNKIKVKSISQNNKKKPLKQNWNTIGDETALVDNILKISKPFKDSKAKLNTTMAIYTKKPNFLPSTISNRDAQNQSQNSRSNKKKDLNYVKQLMNKTVLIPNQDYQPFNQRIEGFNNKINQRVDTKK